MIFFATITSILKTSYIFSIIIKVLREASALFGLQVRRLVFPTKVKIAKYLGELI